MPPPPFRRAARVRGDAIPRGDAETRRETQRTQEHSDSWFSLRFPLRLRVSAGKRTLATSCKLALHNALCGQCHRRHSDEQRASEGMPSPAETQRRGEKRRERKNILIHGFLCAFLCVSAS